MVRRWFAGSRAPVSVPTQTGVHNPAFEPYERNFWLLYERCRYNGIISTARVVDAIRTDDRANIWLMISTAGAGLAGGIKVILHLDTDLVWEGASIISIVLALFALYKKAPEIKYTVFESIGKFDSLAAEVQHLTLGFRVQGSEQAFTDSYMRILGALAAELQHLGPDHTGFEAAHRSRLDRTLKRALRREGIARR
jgi:hypothetical protein